jgi:hypothetical protein
MPFGSDGRETMAGSPFNQILAVSLLFSCCFPAVTLLPEASQQQGNSYKVIANQ